MDTLPNNPLLSWMRQSVLAAHECFPKSGVAPREKCSLAEGENPGSKVFVAKTSFTLGAKTFFTLPVQGPV